MANALQESFPVSAPVGIACVPDSDAKGRRPFYLIGFDAVQRSSPSVLIMFLGAFR